MSTYIDHRTGGGGVTHSWERHTYRNLLQQYGGLRAAHIMGGRDPKTQAGLGAWNRLGRRDAA